MNLQVIQPAVLGGQDNTLAIPAKAKICAANYIDNKVVLFIMMDPKAPVIKRRFLLIQQGQAMQGDVKYIATVCVNIQRSSPIAGAPAGMDVAVVHIVEAAPNQIIIPPGVGKTETGKPDSSTKGSKKRAGKPKKKGR